MAKPTARTDEITIPLPDEQVVAAAIGKDYDPATTLNVVKMFAGTDDLFPALIGMVQAIFGTTDITAREREVIILRAATILDVPYEWQANAQMAANAGLTEAEIDAVAADGPVSGIDEVYVLLARATDELLTNATLTDPTLAALLEHFGETTTRKVVVTISWFSMLSLILNGTRVPMETSDKIGERTSPLG